jgi:hypothetical protein
MSGAIWLITEDANDIEVVRVLLRAKKIFVDVHPLRPARKPGGISRLHEQLEELIQAAKGRKSARDCIAVLHDFDQFSQPNRETYTRIKQVCERHEKEVVLVIARDEIEAWLLADSGLCKWLEIKPRNCDEKMKPSDELSSLVQSKKKLKWQGADRAKVLAHIDGTGDKFSPSMQEALEHLKDAPCVRP